MKAWMTTVLFTTGWSCPDADLYSHTESINEKMSKNKIAKKSETATIE